MDETVRTKALSLRKALAIVGLGSVLGLVASLGLGTVLGVVASSVAVSSAEAQTTGMERRGDRRTGRHDRREDRRTGRDERRQERRQ
jgi:hypothetical protein